MIRAATLEDARGIALVQVRAWLIAFEDVVPPERMAELDVDELAGRWPALMQVMDVQLAEVAGRIAGFVATGAQRDPALAGEGELFAIYVDPAAQGAGLGSTLLSSGEATLRARFPVARLWTFEANGLARRFYEARGWVLDEGATAPPGHEPAAPEVRYRKSFA